VNVLEHHFHSLISNLLDNAFKYSKGGNIYLEINKNSKISIKVEDEGPVIPFEEQGRIFERFYTVSKSRNKYKSGSGLGLSIVKHIAEVYNGTVKLYPNDKGGNTFEVVIYEKI
jgi:two-component system phosphate regulon sensor histidine kinase PhoR